MEHTVKKIYIVIMVSLGLIAISFASIFIKLCEAPSLVIASYRLGIAAIFYWGLTRVKVGPIWRSFSGEQRKIALISGLFLTIHFATWISSLKFTSVASSVVITQTAPIFVALGSFLFLREKPTLLIMIGILIALFGCVIVSVYDLSSDGSSLPGNLLALGGAIGAAGYMIAGRKLRRQIDTLRYVTAVYTIAAMMLLLLAAGSGASFIGYDAKNYLLLIAIAIAPQIIGHTVINWSLKFFSATTVSVVILAEPLGASILALAILGEPLAAIKIGGGLIIINGVLVVLLAESKIRRDEKSLRQSV